jgi:hypothetical protein
VSEGLKEVFKSPGRRRTRAVIETLEVDSRIGRWRWPGGAVSVVLLLLLRVGEDRMGFVDLLEAFFGGFVPGV